MNQHYNDFYGDSSHTSDEDDFLRPQPARGNGGAGVKTELVDDFFIGEKFKDPITIANVFKELQEPNYGSPQQ